MSAGENDITYVPPEIGKFFNYGIFLYVLFFHAKFT